MSGRAVVIATCEAIPSAPRKRHVIPNMWPRLELGSAELWILYIIIPNANSAISVFSGNECVDCVMMPAHVAIRRMEVVSSAPIILLLRRNAIEKIA
jgi:hypothetical protein